MQLKKKKLISICISCGPLLLWCAVAPHPYFRDVEIETLTKRLELCDTSYVRSSRGHAYHVSGRYEKAITDYSTAIQMVPARRDARWNRGQCYLALGRLKEATADATALGRDIEELKHSPIQPIAFIRPFDE